MAAWGLSEEDYPVEPTPLWPENWSVVGLFLDLQTQWRMGMGGPVGLDYNVLPMLFRLNGIARKDQPEYFECLRVMESEALATMHRKE